MSLQHLVERWSGREGGAERANYQLFLSELARALDLPAPDPKGAGLGAYEFEAPVKSEAALGRKGTGRIDLYKRDCFILEAKQSQLKPGEIAPPDPAEPPPEVIHDLFGHAIGTVAPARRAPRYDRLMADARLQAERYALALPAEHKAPPFLIVADIGRAFELYFDWTGNGRGYAPFPDERHYRITLDDLLSEVLLPGPEFTPAEVLRAVWTDPASIDPRLKAAEVTRDIATRLSRVAEQLEIDERKRHPDHVEIALGIEATSLFLMRMLFCMFAEDVELLPKDSFKSFLKEAVDKSALFWRNGLADLWSKMNAPDEANRFWLAGDAIVRYFNGNLFSHTQIFDLPAEFKAELLVAAGKDWRKVEPAIFGTLLEQVLTPADRARLGAHYTPRAYVERLVEATMMEPLRGDWEAVLGRARALADAGDVATAIANAQAFHHDLAEIRVLDPACGTGNFLYVAMEQLLRLEGEVRQFVVGLGGDSPALVHPNQLLGLELNPRAAVIAELVLWIGWLRYRLANTPEAIGEPVLPTLTNINMGTHGGYDSVLVRTATGEPDSENPRRPVWPEADFIIGNPPFIGKGSAMRDALGNDYVWALAKANPNVGGSADFVMQWWDRAADILTRPNTLLRRFGFVTTNSITQVFSRRVIERWLSPASSSNLGEDQEGKLHLTFAIADHPWTRIGKDAAAVRIAMTVAEAGPGEGRLLKIIGERALNTDAPELASHAVTGTIHADLSIGADVTGLPPLRANMGLSNTGMLLAGQGFKVEERKAQELIAADGDQAKSIVRPYVGGGELLKRPRNRYVIDFAGLAERQARLQYPTLYDHLLKHVKPERDANTQKSRREQWWLFGRSNAQLRAAISGLTRFIATTETAKHRVFQFVNSATVPDHMAITITLDDILFFGVLSSAAHLEWVYANRSLLGVAKFEQGHRYNKTLCFDPFPFPTPSFDQQAAISEIAEDLDATRRTALAESPSLTMTGLYNFVAAIREGSLAEADEAAAVRARARIVAKLHDDLDAAVAAAYGWEWPLPPGEIVARLVALNAERAAEEAAGTVRWLRPDYQLPRFGGGAGT